MAKTSAFISSSENRIDHHFRLSFEECYSNTVCLTKTTDAFCCSDLTQYLCCLPKSNDYIVVRVEKRTLFLICELYYSQPLPRPLIRCTFFPPANWMIQTCLILTFCLTVTVLKSLDFCFTSMNQIISVRAANGFFFCIMCSCMLQQWLPANILKQDIVRHCQWGNYTTHFLQMQGENVKAASWNMNAEHGVTWFTPHIFQFKCKILG